MDHIGTIKDGNGHRLIEHFEIQNIPFVFTKHWTGAYGFSKRQEEIIIDFLRQFT